MNYRNLTRLFLFIVGITSIIACKKDLSTLDLNPIDGAKIDTTGNGILSVFQFENLVLTPKLTTNLSDEDLTYEWRINLLPNDTTTTVLSTAKNLDAEVSLPPTKSGSYHQLAYRITDKRNGLKYIMSWQLTIRNGIGEGLVIAETSDGINADLSHIMHPLVTRDFTGERVRHNIYSSINGGKISGIVKQMHFNPLITGLFGITNAEVFKVNTVDYKLAGKNEELFFNHVGAFAPQSIAAVNQSFVYIENGKFYSNYLEVAKKWGVAFDSKFNVPAQVALDGNVNDLVTVMNFYDEIKGQFVYLSSVQSFGDRAMHAYPSVSGKAFDPGNLPNKANVAAGLGQDRELLHLLKDKTSGKLALYVLNKSFYDNSDILVIPSPKAVYDLSAAPGINEAIKFVLYDEQRVMYYATTSKIYVMLFGGGTPIFEERYTAPVGEQITTLQMFQQCDYPFFSGDYIATNNKQLIVSTYTGTEGKVHIMPIKSVGSGTLDLPNVKTFTGFGKITAITTQK
ncbi:PKD-like family lipoprotein [Pedobacter hiemivivus]|uniref:PKD-like family protein n=1 Tax=Pedobacter hiemivivus TaxID=2530454 RepID=A0A4R0NF26_9SPHI|nr:PKD-like family lipoprotein [Pedobacter hiemivivus]TCC97802.1 hypothetical protein EZ444_07785 [Pedobacter hiemivivus]